MDTANTQLWMLLAIGGAVLVAIVAILVYGLNKRAEKRDAARNKEKELDNAAQGLANQARAAELALLTELAGTAIENRKNVRELGYVDAYTVEQEGNGHRPASSAAHSAR